MKHTNRIGNGANNLVRNESAHTTAAANLSVFYQLANECRFLRTGLCKQQVNFYHVTVIVPHITQEQQSKKSLSTKLVEKNSRRCWKKGEGRTETMVSQAIVMMPPCSKSLGAHSSFLCAALWLTTKKKPMRDREKAALECAVLLSAIHLLFVLRGK